MAKRKVVNEDFPEEVQQEKSLLQSLIDEKVDLATKLGLMNGVLPPNESYKKTDEYKRIQEIDMQLWELV